MTWKTWKSQGIVFCQSCGNPALTVIRTLVELLSALTSEPGRYPVPLWLTRDVRMDAVVISLCISFTCRDFIAIWPVRTIYANVFRRSPPSVITRNDTTSNVLRVSTCIVRNAYVFTSVRRGSVRLQRRRRRERLIDTCFASRPAAARHRTSYISHPTPPPRCSPPVAAAATCAALLCVYTWRHRLVGQVSAIALSIDAQAYAVSTLNCCWKCDIARAVRRFGALPSACTWLHAWTLTSHRTLLLSSCMTSLCGRVEPRMYCIVLPFTNEWMNKRMNVKCCGVLCCHIANLGIFNGMVEIVLENSRFHSEKCLQYVLKKMHWCSSCAKKLLIDLITLHYFHFCHYAQF